MIRKTMLAALMVVAVISVPAAFAATSQNAVNQLQNDVNNNRNGMSDSELQRFYEILDDYRADTTNNNLLRQLDNIEGILQSIGPRVSTDDGATDTYDHNVLEDAIAAINNTLTDIQIAIEDILFDIDALKEDIGDLETEDETLDQKIEDEVDTLTNKVQSNWSSIDDIEDVTDDHETRIIDLENTDAGDISELEKAVFGPKVKYWERVWVVDGPADEISCTVDGTPSNLEFYTLSYRDNVVTQDIFYFEFLNSAYNTIEFAFDVTGQIHQGYFKSSSTSDIITNGEITVEVIDSDTVSVTITGDSISFDNLTCNSFSATAPTFIRDFP